MKTIARITILFVLVLLAAACKKKPEPQFIPKWSVVQMLRQQRDELSEWQKLQLAIIFTESKGNPDAVGKNGDSGVYQMLECFVQEANRVSGSNYTHEDAKDIDKAIDIFNRVQDYYNESHDIDEAIKHHNRSAAYKATVMKNLEIVERMEVCRRKLKEYESK